MQIIESFCAKFSRSQRRGKIANTPQTKVIKTAALIAAITYTIFLSSPLFAKTPKTGCSFVAGTKVKTYNGLRNIELIQEGDQIFGYNFTVNENGYYDVTKVLTRETTDFIRINLPHDSLLVTPEHPFFVNGVWVEAGKLQKNDILINPSQQPIRIISIKPVELENPTTVYNFSVDTTENYYVSMHEVLSHNCSITKSAQK